MLLPFIQAAIYNKNKTKQQSNSNDAQIINFDTLLEIYHLTYLS